MVLKTASKTVTAADTAERLNAGTMLVWSAVVRAKTGNTGQVYVGDASVSSSGPGIDPGDAIDLRGDPYLNLFDVFVDADTDGEGVDIWYLEYA
ncbi:MAG: hypothetical protein V3S18_08260 [Dehalococcoidia bacterium]|jgi:hypothetical protein